MSKLTALRNKIRKNHNADEDKVLKALIKDANLDDDQRLRFGDKALTLVKKVRSENKTGMTEAFLAEYGLSTEEGIAVMTLAEALLRVPDKKTIDDLIEDKTTNRGWKRHAGKSDSALVNASTIALSLTGSVLADGKNDGTSSVLKAATKRLGQPVIRSAVALVMRELGHQFVLGTTIKDAMTRAAKIETDGYTYSYDMLGEAALTADDADVFYKSYEDAIREIAKSADKAQVVDNPGISVKLSALHPRYELTNRDRVFNELAPRLLSLCKLAAKSQVGLNIDAEEADRLEISLDVIETVLSDPDLAGWHGFGVVVQAYGKRAGPVIDWLNELATSLDRKIMVRLVKGAYWDTEIKLAQVGGYEGFPVFTKKASTDISYLCCAKKLLSMSDRIYSQFATHNAHSVAAVLEMAGNGSNFEFQRLHGMGEALHDVNLRENQIKCRIYAPVGSHKELLAYLVRRLLENGANSSFVNQIVDHEIPAEDIVIDPFNSLENGKASSNTKIPLPDDIFMPERKNSSGFNIQNTSDIATVDAAREKYWNKKWSVKPLIAGPIKSKNAVKVYSPADLKDHLGSVIVTNEADIETALSNAQTWKTKSPNERAKVLNLAADLYEENFGELFTALTREAGKTLLDAVAEIREAVDFLRYYAAQATLKSHQASKGIFSCISPWNFPIAIFTGQLSAALAAGNAVIAKPAETTPITANLAVKLLHKAGVPKTALQLVPGTGSKVGSVITSDSKIDGVCFTGSTAIAMHINRKMAETVKPGATFIAETGGLNAMIVDSTALPEQAVKDIVASAFQSSGQRCSALRMLYVQKDIADEFIKMVKGAMDELQIGNPCLLSTDVGPVINERAMLQIENHIDQHERLGKVAKRLAKPDGGYYVGPALIKLSSIADLEEEIFGPVLHFATYEAKNLDDVIDTINAQGYGLTFGVHSRITSRVDYITDRMKVGNMYVNRNQIGAVVGSQPFGGEGLSGTGPKAGGPNYLSQFYDTQKRGPRVDSPVSGRSITKQNAQSELNAYHDNKPKLLTERLLPGPTGETNILREYAKGTILCLGPAVLDARRQKQLVEEAGCKALVIVPGVKKDEGIDAYLDRELLSELSSFEGVVLWSHGHDLKHAKLALASRDGPIIPLLTNSELANRCVHERHICIDTTAAGGNASLLASI